MLDVACEQNNLLAAEMDAAEYQNLERVEREHWYYAGKRELVRKWIHRVRFPRTSDTLLDYGAGTGMFAMDLAQEMHVMVCDSHEESLEILRAKFSGAQVLEGVGPTIPLPEAAFEYITALDVLEHTADDIGVVAAFARALKPGGIAIVTVPASMQLWSDWDVGLHHFRRYSRTQLRRLFPDPDWEVIYINYTNVFLYPAVWTVRKWRMLRSRFRRDSSTTRRTEDYLPPRWVNTLLQKIFVASGTARLPAPVGVSLLLVARRR